MRISGVVLSEFLLLVMSACSTEAPSRAASNPAQGGATGTGPGPSVVDIQNPSTSNAGLPTNPVQSAGAAAPSSAQAQGTEPRSREAVAIDECPGALSASEVAPLQAADVKQGSRWLYPYDQTVIPRGLLAPVLQWDGPAAAGTIYLHMRSKSFDYKGCFKEGTAANLTIPQTAWEQAGTQSDGKSDPLTIELTVSSSGMPQRLSPLRLIFALASLKSSVYYSTYNSVIANRNGIIGGVVMRISPGGPQPDVFATVPKQNGDCIGCHAVSVSGNRMIAETHGTLGLTEGTSASYDLTSTSGGVNPPVKGLLKRAGFAALTPDGAKFLTQGAATSNFTGPIASDAKVTNVPGSFGPQTSSLYETDTGKEIPDSGIVPYPYMPMFSVDGKLIIFNAVDASATMTGHTLAVMDFDAQTNKFSNLRSVYRSETRFPGWPFFLPEVARESQGGGAQIARRVIFALGECDFGTSGASASPHQGDLRWLDIDSGVSAPLATANGDDASGKTYLPYPERDPHLNFYPTVSPVAAGGYFWLFFTSKRNYGNVQLTDASEGHSESKKIWVSAIDIEAAPGSDPSHPAFLLPGQELESGNVRAFASLDACRPEGDACASGIDCCCGFCTNDKCQCSQTVACAKLDERCSTAADCCDKTLSCIGGFCGEVIVPD
jgi:hypothetical protein